MPRAQPNIPASVRPARYAYDAAQSEREALNRAWSEVVAVERRAKVIGTSEATGLAIEAWRKFNRLAKQYNETNDNPVPVAAE